MGGALDPTVATGRNLVRSALADLEPGSRVVVGVSGGADSLALAAVTAFVADREAYDLSAVIVDHQLQDGSADVAAGAAEQLAGLGVTAEVVAVDVGSAGGPEASARRARYDALERAGADAVLLAHTLDDQAETVLLGLGRARDPARSRGCPPSTACCAGRSCRCVEPTPSGSAGRTGSRGGPTRTTPIRPIGGPGSAARSCRCSRTCWAAGSPRRSPARPTRCGPTPPTSTTSRPGFQPPLRVSILRELAPALRSRVLRRSALDAGADGSALTASHLAELDRLVTDWRGQVRIELPGGIAGIREGDSLLYLRTPVGG